MEKHLKQVSYKILRLGCPVLELLLHFENMNQFIWQEKEMNYKIG